MKRKLISIIQIIRSKDYVLITKDKTKWRVENSFSANEISQSGKAIYLN